jgi:hypothetical protein
MIKKIKKNKLLKKKKKRYKNLKNKVQAKELTCNILWNLEKHLI